MLQRLVRPLKGAVVHGFGPPARHIHIPTRVQLSTTSTHASALFSNLVKHVGEIVGSLGAARSSTSNAIRNASSISTRVALVSRPFGAPHLPRPPRVAGNITHVGLGTARNFSTGRPIFQHLVENIPVTGRAFYELDWDVKMRLHQREGLCDHKKSSSASKRAQKRAVKAEPVFITRSGGEDEEDIQHYFQTPSPASVVTYLQIPLAPTPTAQAPLSSTAMPHLLPLPAIAKEHATHAKHGIRVASLFRRLDAAKVWARGASCETYGDPSGLCTVLRIKFDDWTEAMVAEVLGDAGKDWCSIQEVTVPPDNPSARDFSDEGRSPIQCSTDNLIIPTIDISAPSIYGNVCDDSLPNDDLESAYSYIPASPESSAWDSGMGEFDTPPMIDNLELSNPEEEWRSVSRASNTSADSVDAVYFTPSHQGALFLELR